MKKLIFLFVLCACVSNVQAQFLGQQSVARSTYVIDKNGHLWVTGWNLYGQLGTGDKTDRSSFVQVPVPQGAARWIMVAGGASHAIAVADSDKLYIWGSNRYGQLGLGLPITSVIPIRVTNPEGVQGWKWVSAGEDHCAALATNGRLYTWGNNDRGQLGSGNHHQIPYPQIVYPGPGASAWNAIAAGPGYTMGFGNNDKLYSWGTDTSSGVARSLAPVRAAATPFLTNSPLMTLGAGLTRQSAVQHDGYYSRSGSHEKLTTIADKLVASVADGANHTLFIQPTGILMAAGYNEHGQLGVGDTLEHRGYNRPYYAQTVSFPAGVTQFVAVSAGMNYSLALGNDGWLYGWGDNSHGELGLGGVPYVTKPVKLLQIGDSIHMNAGWVAPTYDGLPITTTLTFHNLSNSTSLSPTARLIPCDPVVNDEPLQSKASAPAILATGASGIASWLVESGQYYTEPDPYGNFPSYYAPYYAYITAPGSSPYLAFNYVVSLPLNGKPLHDEVSGIVYDSLTMKPLPSAWVNGVVRSDTNGRYALILNQYNKFRAIAYKENYENDWFDFFPFPEGDTLPILRLGPSPIQGFFQTVTTLPASDSVFKVFYPDSLIGYALSSTAIFRTTDSGVHWVNVHSLTTGNRYSDFRFLNPRVGVAVGTNGTISETYNAGNTWNDVTPLTSNNLTSVRFISRDTVTVSPGPIDRYNGTWKTPGRFYGFPAGSWNAYSLTKRVSFNMLDSGKSWISYDGGPHVPFDELPGHAQSVVFYGPYGHVVHDNVPMNYTGHAAPNSVIVWGHVTYNDSLTGIRNARVTRTFAVRNGYTYDSVYTDELGNFMWMAIDSFHYDYKLTYVDDSGRTKSYTWKDQHARNGNILKLVYSDPAPIPPPPPPPDTNKTLDVMAARTEGTSLRVERDGGQLFAVVSSPILPTELAVYDIMGRRVLELPAGVGKEQRIMLPVSNFASGVYYLRLVTQYDENKVRFLVEK